MRAPIVPSAKTPDDRSTPTIMAANDIQNSVVLYPGLSIFFSPVVVDIQHGNIAMLLGLF
jgi:hypothetical protein